MDERAEVADRCCPALEDVQSNERFDGNESFVKTEGDETGGADDERDESPPRVPCVHYASLELYVSCRTASVQV